MKNHFKDHRGSILAVLAAFMLLLHSCIPKPIDIELKPPQPKLVISSQIIPNSIMLVSVTRSFSALSTGANSDNIDQNFLDSLLVRNAIVTVSYASTTDTLYMLSPGIYASINVLQQVGGIYTLHVKDVEGNLEISAQTDLLPLVRFDTVKPAVTRNPTDTIVSVDYTFTDDPNTENYYVVNYIVKLHDTTTVSLDLNNYFSIGSNKVLTSFDLLSDKTFNGTVFSKKTDLFDAHQTDTIAVTLSNISKGYFEFLTAFKRTGTLVNLITGEPINYPTNVEGGYGYFNAHYPDVHFYDLNQY